MTRLEVYQRGLLDLVKSRGPRPGDPYLRRVACSAELGIVREIAIWWRVFALEAQCHFTSRLLKRLGCFGETVASYFDHHLTSPFVEELSDDFLGSLSMHDDGLIRATSQFERAFLKVRAGSAQAFEVLWDRHPDLVFVALENDSELPSAEPECVYRMRIDRDLPGMVGCARVQIQSRV